MDLVHNLGETTMNTKLMNPLNLAYFMFIGLRNIITKL